MVDEFGDSAVELEDLFALLDDGACLVTSDTTPVDDAQLEAGYEEGGLTGTFDQVLVVELGLGEEDLRIGPVLDTGAGRTALCFADDVQAGRLLEGLEGIVGTRGAGGVVEASGHTTAEGHLVHLRSAGDLDVEASGQSVDDRSADAVQAAGRCVGGTAELAAGVQLGHDDLDAGQTGLRLDVDGDAAALVGDGDRSVGGEFDEDLGSISSEGLVDAVVDDFPQTVHETTGIGRADVHAGSLANRFKTGQDGQMPGAVAFVFHTIPLVRLNSNRCALSTLFSAARVGNPSGRTRPWALQS